MSDETLRESLLDPIRVLQPSKRGMRCRGGQIFVRALSIVKTPPWARFEISLSMMVRTHNKKRRINVYRVYKCS